MLEGLSKLAKTLQLCCSEVHLTRLSLGHLDEFNDPICFRKRQWTKQHPVNNRENSRVGANPQGESEHCHSREAGRFAKRSEGEAEILKSDFEERQASALAVILFRLLHAAANSASRLCLPRKPVRRLKNDRTHFMWLAP